MRMRYEAKFGVFFLSSLVLLGTTQYNYLYSLRNMNSRKLVSHIQFKNHGFYKPILIEKSPSLKIPLVTVLCSEPYGIKHEFTQRVYFSMSRQLEQMRVMVGSLLYFSNSPTWRIIIFTNDDALYEEFLNELELWPHWYTQRLQLEKRHTKLDKHNELLSYYRPCAWFKTFLDVALQDLDSAIFVDTDILFTGPPEELWTIYSKLNDTQLIALGPEVWYKKNKEQKYAGQAGVNTGVMVMNLTRMRAVPGGGYSNAMMEEAKVIEKPAGHDQDLANSYLHKHPRYLYELSFKWNFMLSYCSEWAVNCEECQQHGVTIVHGADGSFYRNTDGKLRILYKTFNETTREMSMFPKDILHLMEVRTEVIDYLIPEYICGKYPEVNDLFVHHLRYLVHKRIT